MHTTAFLNINSREDIIENRDKLKTILKIHRGGVVGLDAFTVDNFYKYNFISYGYTVLFKLPLNVFTHKDSFIVKNFLELHKQQEDILDTIYKGLSNMYENTEFKREKPEIICSDFERKLIEKRADAKNINKMLEQIKNKRKIYDNDFKSVNYCKGRVLKKNYFEKQIKKLYENNRNPKLFEEKDFNTEKFKKIKRREKNTNNNTLNKNSEYIASDDLITRKKNLKAKSDNEAERFCIDVKKVNFDSVFSYSDVEGLNNFKNYGTIDDLNDILTKKEILFNNLDLKNTLHYRNLRNLDLENKPENKNHFIDNNENICNDEKIFKLNLNLNLSTIDFNKKANTDFSNLNNMDNISLTKEKPSIFQKTEKEIILRKERNEKKNKHRFKTKNEILDEQEINKQMNLIKKNIREKYLGKDASTYKLYYLTEGDLLEKENKSVMNKTFATSMEKDNTNDDNLNITINSKINKNDDLINKQLKQDQNKDIENNRKSNLKKKKILKKKDEKLMKDKNHKQDRNNIECYKAFVKKEKIIKKSTLINKFLEENFTEKLVNKSSYLKRNNSFINKLKINFTFSDDSKNLENKRKNDNHEILNFDNKYDYSIDDQGNENDMKIDKKNLNENQIEIMDNTKNVIAEKDSTKRSNFYSELKSNNTSFENYIYSANGVKTKQNSHLTKIIYEFISPNNIFSEKFADNEVEIRKNRLNLHENKKQNPVNFLNKFENLHKMLSLPTNQTLISNNNNLHNINNSPGKIVLIDKSPNLNKFNKYPENNDNVVNTNLLNITKKAYEENKDISDKDKIYITFENPNNALIFNINDTKNSNDKYKSDKNLDCLSNTDAILSNELYSIIPEIKPEYDDKKNYNPNEISISKGTVTDDAIVSKNKFFINDNKMDINFQEKIKNIRNQSSVGFFITNTNKNNGNFVNSELRNSLEKYKNKTSFDKINDLKNEIVNKNVFTRENSYVNLKVFSSVRENRSFSKSKFFNNSKNKYNKSLLQKHENLSKLSSNMNNFNNFKKSLNNLKNNQCFSINDKYEVSSNVNNDLNNSDIKNNYYNINYSNNISLSKSNTRKRLEIINNLVEQDIEKLSELNENVLNFNENQEMLYNPLAFQEDIDKVKVLLENNKKEYTKNYKSFSISKLVPNKFFIKKVKNIENSSKTSLDNLKRSSRKLENVSTCNNSFIETKMNKSKKTGDYNKGSEINFFLQNARDSLDNHKKNESHHFSKTNNNWGKSKQFNRYKNKQSFPILNDNSKKSFNFRESFNVNNSEKLLKKNIISNSRNVNKNILGNMKNNYDEDEKHKRIVNIFQSEFLEKENFEFIKDNNIFNINENNGKVNDINFNEQFITEENVYSSNFNSNKNLKNSNQDEINIYERKNEKTFSNTFTQCNYPENLKGKGKIIKNNFNNIFLKERKEVSKMSNNKVTFFAKAHDFNSGSFSLPLLCENNSYKK